MASFTGSPGVIRQWKAMEKKEIAYLERQYESGISSISDSITEKIPEKFDATLKNMFAKAFSLIFEKGTAVIEKTYRKEKHSETYQKNEFLHAMHDSPGSAAAFSRHAGVTRAKNVAISGVEGIGMGLFGVAMPDIPIFTAMIMKSIYETALSYGFDYEQPEERMFLLKIIETSTLHGGELYRADKELNRWIHAGKPFDRTLEEQIRSTSDALAMDLLAAKTVQNIPVVGVLGGSYNVIFIRNLTTYADLKYKRRFLFAKMRRSDQPAKKSGQPLLPRQTPAGELPE